MFNGRMLSKQVLCIWVWFSVIYTKYIPRKCNQIDGLCIRSDSDAYGMSDLFQITSDQDWQSMDRDDPCTGM